MGKSVLIIGAQVRVSARQQNNAVSRPVEHQEQNHG